MQMVENSFIFFKKAIFPYSFLTACTQEKSKPTNQAIFS